MGIKEDQLVNLTDAAKLCGFKGRQALYYHIVNGQGPESVMIGNLPFFDRAKLKDWNAARLARKKGGKK